MQVFEDSAPSPAYQRDRVRRHPIVQQGEPGTPAARRHLLQWFDGQDDDSESGVSHLAHARACLGILIDALATGHLVDDRPPVGASAQLIEQLTKPAVEASR